MRSHRARRSGSGGPLLWAERLLLLAGTATLVWSAVFVADGFIAQWSARSSLEAASIVGRPDPLPTHPAPGTVAEAAPRPPVTRGRSAVAHRGSAIAMLSIPRVHLAAAVLHGSDERTLRRGPGHLENTALPGDAGNVVIAGHRDSYFRGLRNIRIGDDIFLDTPEGKFQYKVESTRVVTPHDLSVLEQTDEAVLTLITCFPFSVLGEAPDRFIVRAAAVVDGAAAEALPGDDSFVRLAVERFRVTYNASLVSRRGVSPRAPVRFRNCEVTVTDDRATATCATVEPSADDPHVRTFMLERADGGWAIRTIVSN